MNIVKVDKSAGDSWLQSPECFCGGGVWGFQLPVSLEDMAGGSEGREFSVLTAWCMKLFLSLAVQQRRLLYLLPEGRRLNSLCEGGWCCSQSR